MTPPSQGPGRGGALAALIISIVLLVAAIGVALWVFLSPGGGDDIALPLTQDEVTTENAAETTEETTEEATEEETEEPERVTETVTEEAERDDDFSAHPGLSAAGWDFTPGTRCSGSETLLYAGTGGDGTVTVCQDGSGNMTYRGQMFGGDYSTGVSAGGSNPAAGRYVVPADPATIIIDGGTLRVTQGGSTLNQASFSDYYNRG